MDTSFRQYKETTTIEMLEFYFSVISRFKWLIIFATVLTALISVAFSVVSSRLPPGKSPLPNIYTGRAILFIQRESGIGLSSVLSSLGVLPAQSGDVGTNSFDYGQVAIKVLQSRPTLDTLIDEFRLRDAGAASNGSRTSARQSFATRSSFAYDRQTGSLSISFSDIDPTLARDVTNRMVTLLEDWFSSTGGSMKVEQKNKLEEKLADVKAQIAALEETVSKFQGEYGVMTPELTLKFSQLTLDLDIQRKVYESLSQEYEIAKLNLETEPMFQVLELAEKPDMKSGPKRGQLCALAVIVAGIASVALAFFLQALGTHGLQPAVRSGVMGKHS